MDQDTGQVNVQAAIDELVEKGFVEVVDEAPAHQPYIDYVAKMLRNVGVTTPDVEVEDDDVAKAYIQMYDADPDTGREVFLCWNEESGWYRGIDQNGSGELNCIRWAHLGVLPEPSEVAAWVATQETTAATVEQMRRPCYRDTGNAFEAAKFLGQLGDYCRRYEYQQWCDTVAQGTCVDCGGSLKDGFGYAPEYGANAGRCLACG
jgi:hypothetical protein